LIQAAALCVNVCIVGTLSPLALSGLQRRRFFPLHFAFVFPVACSHSGVAKGFIVYSVSDFVQSQLLLVASIQNLAEGWYAIA